MTATLTAEPTAHRKAPSALRSGAFMAAGSLVSRATGFVRASVVAAALGAGFVADGYAVGNSVPTIVYMLLLGGALNAVFVPELVKAAKEHADGGAAYTDRLLTLCALALTVLTAAAVLAAPALVDGYTDYTGGQRDLTIAFTRACLPQILFLGLFTLLGQVLNARGRFGAMMWTPVLNNVVVVAVFGLFLLVSDGGELTAGETALLGWGTTAAAVVPAACALFALAVPLMTVVFGYGATDAADVRAMAWTLMALAPGLIALSGQYVCTRAFYALRDTRTPFLLNLVIAGLNALLSLAAYHWLPTRWTVTGMAAGYSLALWAGWALTGYVLRRRLPAADGGTGLGRLLLAAVPGAGARARRLRGPRGRLR